MTRTRFRLLVALAIGACFAATAAILVPVRGADRPAEQILNDIEAVDSRPIIREALKRARAASIPPPLPETV